MQEAARHFTHGPLRTYLYRDRPACSRAIPGRGNCTVMQTNALVDTAVFSRVLHVLEDRCAIGQRLLASPRAERKAQRIHVRIGTNSWITEQAPCATQFSATFENGIAQVGQLALYVPGRIDTGQTGTDDEHIQFKRFVLHEHHVNSLSSGPTSRRVRSRTGQA